MWNVRLRGKQILYICKFSWFLFSEIRKKSCMITIALMNLLYQYNAEMILHIRIPTSPFTILEPQNPWIDESYVVQERRQCQKVGRVWDKLGDHFFTFFK